jgi:hypothetical protein
LGGNSQKSSASTALYVAGVFLLCAASILALRAPYQDYIFATPITGLWETLPATASAGLRLGAFWAITSVVIGLILLRVDPVIGLGDAILGGAAGTWIFAFFAGNLLGPLGLFRTSTIWIIVAIAAIWIARNPPHLTPRAPSTGQKLAILACVLAAVSILPLQLGSPVPPYLDTLNLPAAVQRILTFRRYLPFNNDPYGHWSPTIQTPGLELFDAFLGFGANIRFGVLAVTAGMTPMAMLILLSVYRLGRSLVSDLAGGFAAVLLLATTLLMRAQQMRGTAVDFALVGIAIAMFIDRRRRPLRTAIGALALGTAIASHAIDGFAGLATLASLLPLRILEDDLRGAALEGACLFGALLFAIPEFAVALRFPLPYSALPVAQLAGGVVIWWAAKRIGPRPAAASTVALWIERGIVICALILLLWRPAPAGFLHQLPSDFPLLYLLCMAGLVIVAVLQKTAASHFYPICITFLICAGAEYLISINRFSPSGAQAQFALSDVVYKIAEYWYPFLIVFPAAALCDYLSRRIPSPLIAAILLTLIIFPWFPRPKLHIAYSEHSLAEQWAINLHDAKVGWWQGTSDSRWVQSTAQARLADTLRAEIASGRITPQTHIVQVTPLNPGWPDVLTFSVFTGINDDPYIVGPHEPFDERGYANSRMRTVAMLPAALSRHPPYILVRGEPPSWLRFSLPEYTEIFNGDDIRLYRLTTISPAAPKSGS